ncbi:hypothetical protein Hanom_Chr07g00610221 [Helianthus anomalus]
MKGNGVCLTLLTPLRHAALRAANRVLGEQEPDVLKIHLEQFMLPAVTANPSAYISQPPPSGGSSAAVPQKKPTRIKITGRKYMAASAATPSAGVTVSASGATPAAAEVTSPTHVSKKRKTFVVPTLTAFEAMQAAYALPLGMYLCLRMLLSTTWFISLNILFNTGITGGVQGQGVAPTSLASAGVTSPAIGGTDLSELILKASSTTVVSCDMPSSMPTTAMTMTISPISTPLPSSAAPSFLF